MKKNGFIFKMVLQSYSDRMPRIYLSSMNSLIKFLID